MASNIKQNFLEMKDLSELMVDLAYSAVFLQDKSIVMEVEQLYERIKQLEDDTTMLVLRIKETDEKRMFILDLIEQVKNLSNAARYVAQLATAKQIPSVIKEALGETDERVIVLTVASASPLCDNTLKAAQVGTRTGARILAIKRKGSWIFNVGDDTIIKAEDQLVAKGSAGAENRLAEWAAGKRPHM